MMQTIAEFDAQRVATGRTREIPDNAGAPRGWTRAPLPDVPDGKVAVFLNGHFVIADEPPQRALEALKSQRRTQINQWRIEAELDGFPYVFPDGQTGTVQTRERDMVNIVGLAMGAQVTPGATFHFRDAEDITHEMTAAEVVALGNAAQAFITGNYQQAWALKDQVNQATTVAEVEAITWES